MNYKVKGAIKKNRGNFIIFLILWLAIAICVVAPLSYAWHKSAVGESHNGTIFFEEIFKNIGKPHQTIGKVFSYGKKISMLNKSKMYFQTKYNKINILQKLLLYILILCRNIELLVEIPVRKLIQFIKSKKKIEKKS